MSVFINNQPIQNIYDISILLVHHRYNRDKLNEHLSTLLDEEIKVKDNECSNPTDPDYSLEFTSEKYRADVTIYYLKQKTKDTFNNDMYITEVYFSFF